MALTRLGQADRIQDLLVQADTGIAGFEVDEEAMDARIPQSGAELLRQVRERLRATAPLPDDRAERMGKLVARTLAARRSPLTFEHLAVAGVRRLAYESESRGTQKLLSLLIPALKVLTIGGLVVVDELDSSLHPNLARALLLLFETAKSNPANAQLVFSSHDVALLGSGSLGHDEIWITVKNREGVSTFTPLTDFRIRSRIDVEMAYRNGRFGGTPNLQNFLLEVGRS